MRMLKMISGMVWPLRALSQWMVRLLVMIAQSVRPTMALTRACYVLLGLVLVLGALGAERAGQRECAISLSVAGAILLFLRRIPSAQDDVVQQSKSESDWAYDNKYDGTRIPFGIPVAKPAVPAVEPVADRKLSQGAGEAQMPSDLLKSGWTRRGVAVNKQGEPTLSDDPTATAWSLCGAVNTVFDPDSDEWKSYMRALKALVGHNIVRWNGDSSRTQKEVVAVALKAEVNL